MEIVRDRRNGGIRSLPGRSDPHVQEVVRAAYDELHQLMRQRADVIKRIGTVKQIIVGLANMFGDEVLSEELRELRVDHEPRSLPGHQRCTGHVH